MYANLRQPKMGNINGLKRNLNIKHGQLFGFHFPIVALKALAAFKSLKSDGTNCHLSGPRYDILPCP